MILQFATYFLNIKRSGLKPEKILNIIEQCIIWKGSKISKKKVLNFIEQCIIWKGDNFCGFLHLNSYIVIVAPFSDALQKPINCYPLN